MKTKLIRGALVAALLLAGLFAPAPARANVYVDANNLTATTSSQDATWTNGKPAWVEIINRDSTNSVYVEASATAATATSSSYKVGPCEIVMWPFGPGAGPTHLGYLSSSGSVSLNVNVIYFSGGSGVTPTDAPRTAPIHTGTVPGCSTVSSTFTNSGASVFNGGIQGNFTVKALTSAAAAVNVVKISVPALGWVNGLLHYVYEVTDGTDVQAFGGVIPFSAVAKATTVTCTVGVVTTATQAALAASTGTLTNAITCADGTSNTVALKATDTTSLTATTNQIRYQVEVLAASAPVTITAQ